MQWIFQNDNCARVFTRDCRVYARKMEDVCIYNKYGYCKFKDKCLKAHENRICDLLSCEKKKCKFRHPKTCKFYINKETCKFGEECKYLHRDKKDTKITELETKIVQLCNQLDDMKGTQSTVLANTKRLENAMKAQSDSLSMMRDEIEKQNSLKNAADEKFKKFEREMQNMRLENRNLKKDIDQMYTNMQNTQSDLRKTNKNVEDHIQENVFLKEGLLALESKVDNLQNDTNIRNSNDKAKPTSISAFQKDAATREKSSCSPTTVKEQVKRLDERSTQKCDVCPFPAKSKSCLNIHGNLRNDHSDWIKEITAGINLC